MVERGAGESHDLALHPCEEAVVAVEVKNLLGEETVVGVEKEDDPGLGVEKGTREDLVQEKEKDELGVSNILFFFLSPLPLIFMDIISHFLS